nr:venom polypeptide precursor [Doratifera vulnerans]
MLKLVLLLSIFTFFAQLGLIQACAKKNERCSPFSDIKDDPTLCCDGLVCLYPSATCQKVTFWS